LAWVTGVFPTKPTAEKGILGHVPPHGKSGQRFHQEGRRLPSGSSQGGAERANQKRPKTAKGPGKTGAGPKVGGVGEGFRGVGFPQRKQGTIQLRGLHNPASMRPNGGGKTPGPRAGRARPKVCPASATAGAGGRGPPEKQLSRFVGNPRLTIFPETGSTNRPTKPTGGAGFQRTSPPARDAVRSWKPPVSLVGLRGAGLRGGAGTRRRRPFPAGPRGGRSKGGGGTVKVIWRRDGRGFWAPGGPGSTGPRGRGGPIPPGRRGRGTLPGARSNGVQGAEARQHWGRSPCWKRHRSGGTRVAWRGDWQISRVRARRGKKEKPKEKTELPKGRPVTPGPGRNTGPRANP